MLAAYVGVLTESPHRATTTATTTTTAAECW